MSKYKNADIFKIENIQKKYFLCTWRMTAWCNYSCPYCINVQTRKSYNEAWVADEALIKKAKRINYLIEKNNIANLPIKLKLVGGEITYNNLFLILDQFSTINKLIIITNFSRELDFFKDLYNYCNKRVIELVLTISYHEENIEYIPKAIELTNWCRIYNFNQPQLSFVVTASFNFELLDQLIKADIKNIKITYERYKYGAILDQASDIKAKFDYYNAIFKQNLAHSLSYRVTFTDKHVEEFDNIYQFINDLDLNGFNPHDFYCDATCNKLMVLYDDRVCINRCNFLENKILGTIWDDIKLDNTLVHCQVEPEKNWRCVLCSTISVSREKDL